MLIQDIDRVDGIKLEDRAWVNRHIKDIEIYLSSSVGAILSGEDEVDAPNRAKADEMTLQNTVDELLKWVNLLDKQECLSVAGIPFTYSNTMS